MGTQRRRKITTDDGKSTWFAPNHKDVSVTETDELLSVKIKNDDGTISRRHYDKKNIKKDCEYDHDTGGCFITTACIEAANLPYDCAELEILREFRDRYVVKLHNGTELINEYKQISPEIIKNINEYHNSRVILRQIFEFDIQKAIYFINGKQYEKALNCYMDMINRLKNKYLMNS